MQNAVTLQTFDSARDLDRLRTWLAQPHVSKWWGDADRALTHAQHSAPDAHALIVADQTPVGYLCWQTLPAAALAAANLSGIPAGLLDIDILIGEPERLGRGLGSRALQLLLARFRADPEVRYAGLGTSAANTRAIRCFERAGFQPLREFVDPEWGACMYLIADVRSTP